jgi:NAD(P)-dependent dehydrogenase (short-subunit alcohol dehydrogenase family)
MILNIFSLKNKVSLVTGAYGYLGKQICKTLADAGSDIILIDKNSKKKTSMLFLQELKKKYKKQKFYSFSCDLASSLERQSLKLKLKKFNRIDVFINNAGFTGKKSTKGYIEKFEKQNLKMWSECLEVSLTAIFDLTKILLPKLKTSKACSIINISSIYGVYGPDWSIYENTSMANPASYAAAKSGLIQFTKWLSKTVGPKIRVNAISPGGIYRKQPKNFVTRYVKKTSLKRMAKESDFDGIILLLASNASSYITGQNIIVDGGWGS